MVFVNYKTANLAKGNLLAGISAAAISMILESGQGDLFPSVYPYLLKIEHFDPASTLENKPVLKRNIVKVTNKAGDTFTIVRSAGFCPASDTDTTQSDTPLSFDAGDTVTLIDSAEQFKDIADEITRLEADKADDDEVVHLTGDESIDGEKTFTSSPIIPDGVDPDHAVNKSQLDAASSVTSIVDKDTFIAGEDIDSGESLFREDMITFADTVNTSVVTDTGGSLTTTNNTTQSRGHRMYAEKPIIIVSVTKDASSAATQATIKDDAGTILATQAFVGNVATFATEVVILQKTYFRIEADAAGASYNSYIRATGIYPAAGTNAKYVTGSAAGANTAQAGNIVSIQTIEYTIQKIGDIADNTRCSIPVFGNGIAGSTFKLSLKKFTSPGVNLGIRIETDNAGSPSGTLVNVNATATVTAASLTTSLVDTTVTLAGSITIPKGTKVHIVLFAGTYGAETINSTNYYGIGFKAINTTTRFEKMYNGSSWYNSFTYSPVVDDDNIALTTNQSTTNARGWYMQAQYDLTLTTVNKNSNVTATRCIIKNAAGVTLTTQAFSGNVATLASPQNFLAGEYFTIELDSNGASYTSRFLSAATIPQTRTNVVYVNGSENSSSTTTTVYNIDSVSTTRYMSISDNMAYVSGSIFDSQLLSLTDSDYSYKIPKDIVRLATETVTAGDECICTTMGINNQVTGLTQDTYYYISSTPGGLSSTPGTYQYLVGLALTSGQIYILNNRQYLLDDEITSVEQSQANGTTTGSAIRFLNGGIVTVQLQITNASGNSRDLTASLQYSNDNVNWVTVKSLSQSSSSNISTVRGTGQTVFTYIVKPGMYIRLYTYSSGLSATSYANLYYQSAI